MHKALGGVLLALAAVLLLAPSASAIVYPASYGAEFELRGSNGYEIGVSADSEYVSVVATKKRTAVQYVVRGRLNEQDGIRARLPGIGQIAVAFRPVGKPRSKPPFFPGCSGGGEEIQHGIFTGTIRIRGERGFTEVARTRAVGRVIDTRRETCESGGKGERGSGGVQTTALDAIAVHGGSRLSFSAGRFELDFDPSSARPVYFATLGEQRNGMLIIRTVMVEGSEASFTADAPGPLSSASVDPPSPFTGTAEYAVNPDGSGSWTGDLSVAFPGTGPVRLAGKRFEARLCFNSKCSGDRS
jgi:hypothetical protein